MRRDWVAVVISLLAVCAVFAAIADASGMFDERYTLTPVPAPKLAQDTLTEGAHCIKVDGEWECITTRPGRP